jgi:hypothetical protein
MTIPTRGVASGIRFNDCFFSEPVSLADCVPQGYPGLFAILTFDLNWAPRPLRVLCFGEFGNDTPAHVLLRDCSRTLSANTRKDLFVCVLPMPFTTTAQRCALRDELISAYNPACQTSNSGTSRELAQKVDELERRQHEQNAQAMMLAAGISRFFDPPPPSRPRRRIGFNPLSEPAS